MGSILIPRLGNLAKRVFGLKESPPSDSTDHVNLSFDLVDPADPFFTFDRGERRLLHGGVSAAVAAQLSFARLENATAAPSPMVAVLEQIDIIGGAAATGVALSVVQATGVGVAGGGANLADTRIPFTAIQGVISPFAFRTGSRAASLGGFYQLNTDAQSNLRVGSAAPLRIVLGPGFSLDVEFQTVNLALRVTFVYRYFELEPSMAQ